MREDGDTEKRTDSIYKEQKHVKEFQADHEMEPLYYRTKRCLSERDAPLSKKNHALMCRRTDQERQSIACRVFNNLYMEWSCPGGTLHNSVMSTRRYRW